MSTKSSIASPSPDFSQKKKKRGSKTAKMGVAELGYDKEKERFLRSASLSLKTNTDQKQILCNVLNVSQIISTKMVIKKGNRTIFV
jgi:hypothetical protein